MISTLFFDLGGVIVTFDIQELFDRIARYSPFDSEVIEQAFRRSEDARLFELGLISTQKFYESARRSLQLDMTYDRFVPIFSDIFSPNPAVVELIDKLNGRLQLGIISNTNEAHYTWIEERIDVLRRLAPVILSYKEQVRKPGYEIFEIALERAGTKAEAAAFIDDLAENVQAARDLDMKAIHYTDSTDLEHELKSIGINLDDGSSRGHQ